MLELTIITEPEQWDEVNQQFIPPKGHLLRLEHSLVSISKWESKWHKPFLSKLEKTQEEVIDYIKCMTTTQNVDPDVYNFLSIENVNAINEYINAPMTATTFSNNDKNGNREVITAEIIYYWMIALNIPFECQKWHLNRLLTLVKVCSIKNQPSKKMSKKDIMSRNAALNAARRQQYNTKG
mgnify:CR=1 FL=1